MRTHDLPVNRPHGRGAFGNTEQRFSALQMSYDPGEEPEKVATKFFRDHSSSIISHHKSPDLPFEASLNPYRGCEHGCAYCYARPTHEWLGWSAGVDFESRILVKMDAPALLRQELARDKYTPERLSLSGVTDCYQPAEKRLQITRGCLAVLAECRHPVVMITKNHLITRDMDHLSELARHQATSVYISVTSLDADLARKLEPRASSPKMRLEAIRALAGQGIPVGVSVAPIIPGLNDSEIPAILQAAKDAGAMFAGYTVVRLPFSVKDVFAAWLQEHFPGMKDKVLNRIEETQGRTLSHPEFGKRLKGVGVWSQQIEQIFKVSLKREGLLHRRAEVTDANFRRPREIGGQMELW
ncbi:DNA repair photolyase [Prosthecobacter debontii]|uniref:DNA repair photolyase n=1 Tax=Prosthecobacter debontii TaxID=48467 RepID=A0A1T4XSL3_9BACT|nr:PA0069 family radical SAM protein [Prosthecobacter debontii]SKA92128.1 DNA repair photolyase [Prosthecobacter debontii]